MRPEGTSNPAVAGCNSGRARVPARRENVPSLYMHFRRLIAVVRAAPRIIPRPREGYAIPPLAMGPRPSRARNAERRTPNVQRRTPHHAHCRMSFVLPAVCTMVTAYRSASKVAALEKLYANSNGTKSACMAAPKDRKHRLINSNRPNDATSLLYFAPRGRLDPTTRIVDSYRPNECSDDKSKG